MRIRPPRALREQIIRFDTAGERLADTMRGRPIPDRIFYTASELGDHGKLWLAVAAGQALRGGDAVDRAIRLGLSLGADSALVNGAIKSMFRRERPVPEYERPLWLRKPRTSSFPSGHASSAFVAAALLGDGEHQAVAVAYYVAAVIVAWSRVHVKIHHPSDVVGGVVIGAALGAGIRHWFPLG